MTEPTEKERTKPEAGDQKSAFLTVRILWTAHAFNATPEDAAEQVVSDLFQHLSQGGSVSVHVEELGGEEHLLDVPAGRR